VRRLSGTVATKVLSSRASIRNTTGSPPPGWINKLAPIIPFRSVAMARMMTGDPSFLIVSLIEVVNNDGLLNKLVRIFLIPPLSHNESDELFWDDELPRAPFSTKESELILCCVVVIW
jgi:hypothetical protein